MLISFSSCQQKSFDSSVYNKLYEMGLCGFITDQYLADISGLEMIKRYAIPVNADAEGISSKCFIALTDVEAGANYSILIQGFLKPSSQHLDVFIRGLEDLIAEGKARKSVMNGDVPVYFDQKVNTLYLMTHPDRYIAVAAGTKQPNPQLADLQNEWIGQLGERLLAKSKDAPK